MTGGRDRTVNRLELVSRWADDLAHEIKNPFHSMVINLELVKRRAGDPEELVERAEVVESELRRVHALIDSVLRLVRPWAGAPAAAVDAVFGDLEPALRARARLRHVQVDYEGGAGRVGLTAGDLALVLLNLVDNAMDALPDGGRVTVRCVDAGDAVRIDVTDDGPGLAVDGDPFEPGVTTRADRSGLGLAVCGRLVRQAGGSITAGAAVPGPGTTIALTLPRPGTA